MLHVNLNLLFTICYIGNIKRFPQRNNEDC
ncbi:hypothetical protein H206_05647 [Candidatus Electrothrix aarhusensis]|uniref:Uncharacterized protein n=1 Tax=Candidatus Electrothrix aarhusensis TaxID=1859131 RepID=A0A3S3RA04_9BACT|nr:hypothetical protein H206_05647 [Candidatus Electrothrix aarhusensis]